MSTKQVSEGKVLTLTAPEGGVTAGQVVKIGNAIGIVQETAAQDAAVAVAVQGVHSVTKVGSQAWSEGDAVFWDDGNSRFTKTVADGLILAGVAVEAVGNGAGATTGKVLLLPALGKIAAATYAFDAGTNLTAVPGSFADEAAVKAYLDTLVPEIEARLDAQDVANVAVRAILVENGYIPNA